MMPVHRFTTPGWITFGQPLVQGDAKALKLGPYETQVDVKNLWPDGSIRFAAVTAKIEASGEYPLLSVTPKGLKRKNAPIIPLTVTCIIQGEIWKAELTPSFRVKGQLFGTVLDKWLTGVNVDETRYLLPVMNSAGAIHPLLTVVCDLRSYADGSFRVDVQTLNLKNSPEMDVVTYDLVISIDGETAFTQQGVNQYLGTRWRKVYSVNLTEAEMVPDLEPMYASGAFPRFLPDIYYQTFPPCADTVLKESGNMSEDMGATGGRAEIGNVAFWDALYCVHKTQELRTTCIENGNAAGYWSSGLTEMDGLTPITIDKHPDFWFDARMKPWPGYGPDIPLNPDGSFRGDRPDEHPDLQHVPSVNFLPYLITGDRWHNDEMGRWAAYAIIKTYTGNSAQNGVDFTRKPAFGQNTGLDGHLSPNGSRGFAWPLRLLIEAAGYLPDSNPLKDHFWEMTRRNLTWLTGYCRDHPVAGPINAIFWERDTGTVEYPYGRISVWQAAYLAAMVQRAIAMGLWGTEGSTFRDRCARMQIKLFTSDQEYYPWMYAGTYYARVVIFDGLPPVEDPPETRTIPRREFLRGLREDDDLRQWMDPEVQNAPANPQMIPTMQGIWSHNFDSATVIPPNSTNPEQPWVGYYDVEAWMLVTMGLKYGLPGAELAKARLLSIEGVQHDILARPGFAVDYGSSVGPVVRPPRPASDVTVF